MEDRKVVYIYNMWFNPNKSKGYGDCCFGFSKESCIAILDEETGKYQAVNYSDEFYIFDDGSNSLIRTIDVDDEYISIYLVSFDNNIMEEFKMKTVRMVLDDLWELIRTKKDV